MAKPEETKKVIPQRQSVHVVFFSCENCGEEVEYIQFCHGKQDERYHEDPDYFCCHLYPPYLHRRDLWDQFRAPA